jgi:LPS O-antigen subunit length determinant protein (WzzB/FepE family)
MSPSGTTPSVNNSAFFENAKSTSQNINEIDLIDLLTVFLGAKVRIMTFILIFILAGFIAYSVLPQKWTTKAIVTLVEPTQLNELQQALTGIQILGIDYPVDRTDMFNLFIKKFQSQQFFKEYVESTPSLTEKLSAAEDDPETLRRAISEVSKKMNASDNYTGKGESEPLYRSWTLSFTGPNAKEAQSVLIGYIDFISEKTTHQIVSGVRNALELKIKTERERLALDLAQLQNSHNSSILRLSYSLEIAKAAGLKEPVYGKGQTVNDDPEFSVALGANGIASKLEIEKAIKDLTQLNPELKNREYRLMQLEAFRIKDISIPVIGYQQSPSYPIKKDGPGMVVFLLLSAILGGLVGCASVLLCNAIGARKVPVLPQ